MQAIKSFPHTARKEIRWVLTDIDDTLTTRGRLGAEAYQAMERLQTAGIRVVPITGRPAGWCDHIARMWPVDAVVGENGAFYFTYDEDRKKMVRRYWKSAAERRQDRERLNDLAASILQGVPGCRIASDQAYREADLAVDFCEDVPPLPQQDIRRIVDFFEEAGARAKISSIHVNGWFGDYDKLSMTRILFREIFSEELDGAKTSVLFIGDSPNDAPMFAYFPHSVGVANVKRYRAELTPPPAWVTDGECGRGFAEMAALLLL